ncbi:MAG: hypothetical protein LBB83_07340 [Treponema sp.]|jgi:hypothetical protein|nr:hypothetical protein [Treponema sp.]
MCKRDTEGFLSFGKGKKSRVEGRIPIIFAVLLLLFMPFTVFAEDLRLTTKVQIMPITGTNLVDAEPIMEAMIAEVQRTEGFTIVQSTGMSDDVVNPTEASSEAEYSISGTLIEEVGDTLFQISLWRLSDSALMLSEELVYVDLEEGLDMVPILVWSLLGNIPAKTMPVDTNWRTKWLYLGLLTGGTLTYDKLQGFSASDNSKNSDFEGDGLGLSPSVSLAMMVPFLNIPFKGDPKVYLELQTEVLFSWEWAGYTYHHKDNIPPLEISKSGVWTDQYSFLSLTFPLMLKIEFHYGPLMLAPYGGAYFYLPLGNAQSKSNRIKENIDKTKYSEEPDPSLYREQDALQVSVDGVPLGMTFGFYTGIKMGPGALVIDLRYSRDFGTLTFKDQDGKNTLNGQYIGIDRNKFSLMVGYEIGLFKHERKMEVQVE